MGQKKERVLGKALINKNKIQWSRKTNAERHTKEDPTTGLKSVTEESSYDEFIATATLAQKDFTAEKLNIKFVSLNAGTDLNATDVTEEEKKLVVVPRRPKWSKEMTAQELDEAEKEVFLEWRRSMATLQEKEGITPFERNIEVWRQLWRVVEKSDIIVQIVDARNPLLYWCNDLESYVREMGKLPVLLINKADYLTEQQRVIWSKYFSDIKLSHAFYSAAAATEALKESIDEEDETRKEQSDYEDLGDSEPEDGEEDEEYETAEEAAEPVETPNLSEPPSPLVDEHKSEYSPFGISVLDREGLIDFLRSFKTVTDEECLNVGLVGYPNVGKSSTINSLMATKKTSVSSTPGKTKHFQTLFLEKDVLLCDCPGLVMPAFGGSKGAMVLGGILPIDQLRSYAAAIALLKEQVPKEVIEAKYGIILSEDYNFEDIVSSYAQIRGFMTARGLPDSSRAARIVLKDYVEGRVNYCHAPPDVDQAAFHPPENYKIYSRVKHVNPSGESSGIAKKPTLRKPNVEGKMDDNFFRPVNNTAHVKGKIYIPSGLSSTSASSTSLTDKPWKRHNNKHKKEKLRITYRHLDVE